MNSRIIMYQTEDGLTKIETTFDNDSVWLSIEQMAELFQRDRSVIGKHIRNVFKEGELEKDSVWAKFAHTEIITCKKCTLFSWGKICDNLKYNKKEMSYPIEP